LGKLPPFEVAKEKVMRQDNFSVQGEAEQDGIFCWTVEKVL